jgi:asparagine synthase (glutamine-hydrolysing)
MCGFGGVVDLRRGPPGSLAPVAEALAHRGPDARNEWREGPCALVHCRLRVLDLSARADQPMASDAARVVVVYNGEIYNFRELRAELEAAGWSFTTRSDTEVLLAGYQAWGSAVFARLRGMFAAAFWHPDEQRLTLARDPLGKKPLVYAESPGRIAFASSIGALLPLLESAPAVDRRALDCYLGHTVVPFEHAIFEGVTKLPPGGLLEWNGGRSRTSRFWRVPAAPAASPAPPREVAAELERLLRTAVRRRLESDVPLGLFLSAGFDSSLVAALAAEEHGGRLVAVTAGTVGSGYDERSVAALVAQRYHLEHRLLEVPALSAASLPMLLAELGEPFGDSSILPSYDVARAARREITVALTGDGGDESFFGYATFRGVRLGQRYRRWVPSPVRRLLHAATDGLTREGWLRRAGALFEYGVGPISESYRNRMGFSGRERSALLRGAVPGHSAEHVYAERLERFRNLPDADALRRTFFETYLPNDYLAKVDTATMAASLEARSPFLDLDVVEFALSLPEATAFRGGQLKALLRPLVVRLLPPEVLQRPKTGFGVPVGDWMRGPLAGALEEFVFRPDTAMAGLIDPVVARRVYAAHLAGADHGTRLWSLLCLGVWSAVVLERRWASTEPLPVDRARSARAA